MRHLGYALVALLCTWSIAIAKPKKKGGDKTAKTPAGQKQPAPKANAPKVDPALQAEIEKVRSAYYALAAKPKEALKLAKQLYDLQVKATGAESIEAERQLFTLASAYQQAGDMVASEKTYRQHLALVTKKYGLESREILQSYSSLYFLMYGQTRYVEAEGLHQHILALTKKLDGEKSAAYAQQLSQYASLLTVKNEWGAALRTYEEVLKIYEAIGKPDDWTVVSSIQMVGMTYWQMNQQAKAIPLFDRAIKIALAATDQMLTVRISVLLGVASMYNWGGRKDLSVPLYTKAIDLAMAEIAKLEKTAPDDWQLSSMYTLVAGMYRGQNDFAKAEEWYLKYEKWAKKKGQAGGMEAAIAEIKRAQGKNKEALALLEKARDWIAKLAPQSAYAYSLMMGDVVREMGDYKRAVKLYDEYTAGLSKQLGKDHPAISYALIAAVNAYAAAGNFKKAEVALDKSLDVSEKDLQTVLRVGTDTDHAIYFSRFGYVLDNPINFNVNYQPKSGSAARIALTTILRRKGRLLDAAAAALATIRAKLSTEDKKLLDELNAARASLSKLTVAGPGVGGDTAQYGKDIAVLEDKIQKLEAQVSKKSAAYRTVTQPIEMAPIQKMIPKDARLVEIINYQPYDPKLTYAQLITGKITTPRRYLAYIAATKGDPTFVDLGEAPPIDKAIEGYRKALADPDNDSILDLGKALNDLTFAKVIPKLGGSTNILIAPDGALNVVPFSALVDDKKEFLIKKYTFTYLTSGRDLLRLTTKTKAQGGGVLFADPKFDSTGGAAKTGTGTRGARSADLASLQWPQLPGTAAEADAIVKTFKGLKVYRGEQATEGTIKKIKGPKILHLATHGFFLPDDAPPADDSRGAAMSVPGLPSAAQTPVQHENPLLRSGLAFAGANKLASDKDDGLLTALEASGLDLWGTKLVVLSACETGVGKVTNGDGVYGLRRSLVIAGAESLVMSMWQVDDFATKELMSGFYKRLAAGKGRSSALRDVQLELLAQKKYAHPFYWAAFLPAGATTPLKD